MINLLDPKTAVDGIRVDLEKEISNNKKKLSIATIYNTIFKKFKSKVSGNFNLVTELSIPNNTITFVIEYNKKRYTVIDVNIYAEEIYTAYNIIILGEEVDKIVSSLYRVRHMYREHGATEFDIAYSIRIALMSIKKLAKLDICDNSNEYKYCLDKFAYKIVEMFQGMVNIGIHNQSPTNVKNLDEYFAIIVRIVTDNTEINMSI